MTGAQQHQESLENGEPLLESRQLACDASRKGLPWRSERIPVEVTTGTSCCKETHKSNLRTPQKEKAKKSADKKIYISSVKKAQFSHMLPDQRDSCIHQSPIVYQHKGSEQSRRSEVAPLWYHPFQAGH